MTLDLKSAFLSSFLAILASEIGDKTFFIAAILAMKQPRLQVFLGAFGALSLMHILSSCLGSIAPSLIPIAWTHYASIVLFFVTGVLSLREGLNSKSQEEEEKEMKEVEKECCERTNNKTKDTKSGGGGGSTNNSDGLVFLSIFLRAFTLTFVAEWGDRSQLVTIGLAAVRDVYGVIFGGVVGHALCTGGAVIGGKQFASYVNEQLVSLVGGSLFLLFGFVALLSGGPQSSSSL